MFSVISVDGGPEQYGEVFGAQAKERIALSLSNYDVHFRSSGYEGGLAEAQEVAVRRYLKGLEQLAPEMVAELRAMSRASGVSFEALVALNCRTELLSRRLPDKKGEKKAEVSICVMPSECTTVNIGDFLGQNWDWMLAQHDACAVMKTPTFVTLTEAGILCKMGMNASGLAATLNLLVAHADFSRSTDTGDVAVFPIHMILRKVLQEAHTTQQAVDLVKKFQYDASSCLTFCDATGHCVAVEISPSAIHCIDSNDDDDRILTHSNHFAHVDAASLQLPNAGYRNSCQRRSRARELAKKVQQGGGGELSIDALRMMFSDHNDETHVDSLCRHPKDTSLPKTKQFGTISCLLFFPAQKKCYITGLACHRDVPFQQFEF